MARMRILCGNKGVAAEKKADKRGLRVRTSLVQMTLKQPIEVGTHSFILSVWSEWVVAWA